MERYLVRQLFAGLTPTELVAAVEAAPPIAAIVLKRSIAKITRKEGSLILTQPTESRPQIYTERTSRRCYWILSITDQLY